MTLNKKELNIVRIKYIGKMYRAKYANIDFLLSFNDYIKLINDAGISVYDIGRAGHQYCLGRKCKKTGIVDGDLPYSIDTCRFITKAENTSEAEKGPSFRAKMSIIHKGKSISDTQKKGMSDRMIGNTNLAGFKQSDHSKKVTSDRMMGTLPWDVYNTTETQLNLWKIMPEIQTKWVELGQPKTGFSLSKIYGGHLNKMVIIFRDKEKYEKILKAWRKKIWVTYGT